MPFNIMRLSETYLNFSTTSNDDDLEISGDNLIRSDHLSNHKRGGVCIHYTNFAFASSQYSISTRIHQFRIKYWWQNLQKTH